MSAIDNLHRDKAPPAKKSKVVKDDKTKEKSSSVKDSPKDYDTAILGRCQGELKDVESYLQKFKVMQSGKGYL